MNSHRSLDSPSLRQGGDENEKTQHFDLVLRFAERQGFEPWDQASWSTVFETAPIDHSGISPSFENGCKSTNFFRHGKMFFLHHPLSAG